MPFRHPGKVQEMGFEPIHDARFGLAAYAVLLFLHTPGGSRTHMHPPVPGSLVRCICQFCYRGLLRISAPYLNNSLEKAVACRSKILKKSLKDDDAGKSQKDEHPFGEDVKMVRQHKLKCRLLTPTEQDEVVTKYKSGMTMTAIADEYGCHYTTVGRLLRARGVEIRQ